MEEHEILLELIEFLMGYLGGVNVGSNCGVNNSNDNNNNNNTISINSQHSGFSHHSSNINKRNNK